jgi:hypothetical protein
VHWRVTPDVRLIPALALPRLAGLSRLTLKSAAPMQCICGSASWGHLEHARRADATLGGVDGNHFAGGCLEHELAGQAGDRAGQSLAAQQDNDVAAVAKTKRNGRINEMNAAVGFDDVSRHGQPSKIAQKNRNKRLVDVRKPSVRSGHALGTLIES